VNVIPFLCSTARLFLRPDLPIGRAPRTDAVQDAIGTGAAGAKRPGQQRARRYARQNGTAPLLTADRRSYGCSARRTMDCLCARQAGVVQPVEDRRG